MLNELESQPYQLFGYFLIFIDLNLELKGSLCNFFLNIVSLLTQMCNVDVNMEDLSPSRPTLCRLVGQLYVGQGGGQYHRRQYANFMKGVYP